MYKAGPTNCAIDALSRKEIGTGEELVAISTGVLDWLEAIVVGYQDDPQSSKLLNNLMVSGNKDSKFQLKDGVLKIGDRIWVENNALVQQDIPVLSGGISDSKSLIIEFGSFSPGSESKGMCAGL